MIVLILRFRPRPGDPPRIERDDFPAPPYPYTDPERRRRWSESSKRISVSEVNDYDDRKYEHRDVVDGENDEHTPDDPKIKVKAITKEILSSFRGLKFIDLFQKSEAELSKIATGIGKVFLHNLKEREKMRQWKMSHLDPRNASRTPSANKVRFVCFVLSVVFLFIFFFLVETMTGLFVIGTKQEPPLRLRYESPINASPSRFKDHPRPFDYEEPELDRQSAHRSSLGRSIGTLPSYNGISTF